MDDSGFSLYRENLSGQVADHLEQVILSSTLLDGSKKLPSEQQLATDYKVSRPVIREALKLLQERGLVLLKNGLGAFVTKPPTTTLLSAISRIIQTNNISDDDLTEVRGMLEINAARLAAEHISDELLAQMDENLEKFCDRTLPLKKRVELDSEFHDLISRSSGNVLLEVFDDVLTSMLSDYMGKGVLIAGGIDDAIKRHTKILNALKAHDPEAAMIAMKEHLAASQENVKQFARKGVDVSAPNTD